MTIAHTRHPLSHGALLAALALASACASPAPALDASPDDALSPPDASPDASRDAPVSAPPDAPTGPYCGLFRCASSELCCAATALCYAPSCADCCAGPRDAATDSAPLDAAADALADVPRADSAPPDAAPDVAVDHAAPSTYALHPSDTVALPSHGAGGGAPYTFVCPAGRVAVGIAGYADTSVNAIALRCCDLMADGTVNNSVMTLPIAGSRTGTFFQDRCPANNTVVGWDLSADTVVRQLTLQCTLLTDQVRGLNGPTAQPPHGTATVSPVPERCPAGYALTGLAGAGDGPLTSVRGTCTRVGE